MRKTLGPTKYTREKVLSPRNTHRNKFRTHEIPTTKAFGRTKYPQTPTTPTITYDPLSFAQSSKFNLICFFFKKKVRIFYLQTAFRESFSNTLLNTIELSEAATERCS